MHDPSGARRGPFFRERGDALKRSILAVHAEVARQAETWPRRRLITFHGSLFYFASRYGLQVVGACLSEPHEQGLKDTVLVDAGSRVRVIAEFADFADPDHPYMYHCHNLEHEDSGMMGQFVVI